MGKISPYILRNESFSGLGTDSGGRSFYSFSVKPIAVQYLNKRLVVECLSPITPGEAQDMAEKRDYLMQTLLRLQVYYKEFPNPSIFLRGMMNKCTTNLATVSCRVSLRL